MKFKESCYKFLSRFGVQCFQKIFPEYFAKDPLAPTDRFVEYYFLSKHLPRKASKILDVGCAASFLPLMLAGMGHEVTGIDIRSYAFLNKIAIPGFKFVQADICQSGLASDSFDLVTAISTIEHIGISGRYGNSSEDDGDEAAVSEMHRVLRAGGELIVTMPFGKYEIIKPYMRVNDEERIRSMFSKFQCMVERYFMQDSVGDWIECSKDQALTVNVTPSAYPLVLLFLRKK